MEEKSATEDEKKNKIEKNKKDPVVDRVGTQSLRNIRSFRVHPWKTFSLEQQLTLEP